MKKIPEGAEATAVLVGAVDFLKHPTIAFVRLAEGVMMDNLVEVGNIKRYSEFIVYTGSVIVLLNLTCHNRYTTFHI